MIEKMIDVEEKRPDIKKIVELFITEYDGSDW